MEQQGLFGADCGTCGRKVKGLDVLDVTRKIKFGRTGGGHFVMDLRTGEVDGTATNAEVQAATKIARDLDDHRGKNFRYVSTSAMHKEVRRGDVAAAIRWARLNVAIQGMSKVKQYLKNILLEETRNLALVDAWQSLRGVAVEDMVRSITASRKRWEMPAVDEGMYDEYMAAYVRARANPTTTPKEIDAKIQAPSRTGIYEVLWQARMSKDEALMAHFWMSGIEALRDQDFHWLAALESRRHDTYYAFSTLAEALVGDWTPDGNDSVRSLDTPPVSPDIEVPALHAYVYDRHTRPGKKAMVRYLRDHKAGAPQPGNLDLRWAGMGRGAAWRYAAYAQHGIDEYVDKPWEAVDIDPATWEASVMLDVMYSPGFHRQAGVTVGPAKVGDPQHPF